MGSDSVAAHLTLSLMLDSDLTTVKISATVPLKLLHSCSDFFATVAQIWDNEQKDIVCLFAG